MAAEDFGGKVLGKPIAAISADHQIKPDVGAGIARQWYDVDHVNLIVDVPVSAVSLAVQQIANDRKKLFITHSTGTADFHGCSARLTRCNGCRIRTPSPRQFCSCRDS
jgi:branched-chain amino acid transport system substrate-binding protein